MKLSHHFLLPILSCFLLSAPAYAQTTYYWDGNDSAVGFGAASGTWAAPTAGTTTSGWTTSTNGSVIVNGNSITTALTNDTAYFGNGATGLASGTITVSGTVEIGNIRFASGSGAIILSGGSIDISRVTNAEVSLVVDNALATITSNLVGSSNSAGYGITKSGSGMLVLSGDNSGYSGRTTITHGVLKMDSVNALPSGLLTFKNGGGGVLGLTANLTRTNVGYAPGNSNAIQWSGGTGGGFAAYGADRTVTITDANNGSTVNFSSENMSVLILGHSTADSKVTWASALNLGGAAAVIQSGNGLAAIDGAISGIISDSVGTGSLTKTGAGTLALSGLNTFTGNTTVSDGALILQDNAQLRFAIGDSGVNNGILGTGILQLDGDLMFDLSLASTNALASWNIVDVANLTETYGSTFSVLSANGSFAESAGLWTIFEKGTTYQFSESTGMLTVIPEPRAALLGTMGLLLLLRRKRCA